MTKYSSMVQPLKFDERVIADGFGFDDFTPAVEGLDADGDGDGPVVYEDDEGNLLHSAYGKAMQKLARDLDI